MLNTLPPNILSLEARYGVNLPIVMTSISGWFFISTKIFLVGVTPHTHPQPLPCLKNLWFNKKIIPCLWFKTKGRYTPYLASRENIQGGNVRLAIIFSYLIYNLYFLIIISRAWWIKKQLQNLGKDHLKSVLTSYHIYLWI